jgi:hypothetical protein
VTEAVHRAGIVTRLFDLGVVRIGIGELPVIDPVHRHPSYSDGALLADDGDRALEVLRVGEHRDVHRAKSAGTPADAHHAGIFHLDVPLERGGIGLHALDRTDKPVEQVHVMAGLIHKGTAVELPGSAPRGAVVVGLRPAPEDVDGDHVDPAEAALLHRALE